MTDADNPDVASGRFLKEPHIEPTNNRAERALRPAVIARKVSHGSKNIQGAEAFAAFTSVLKTLARSEDRPLIDGLRRMFTDTSRHAIPPAATATQPR